MAKSSTKKSRTITFRVTNSDYLQIEALAFNQSISVGEWARKVILRNAFNHDYFNLSSIERILLEELLALRAIMLTLLIENNPSPERIKTITSKADEIKTKLADSTLNNHLKVLLSDAKNK